MLGEEVERAGERCCGGFAGGQEGLEFGGRRVGLVVGTYLPAMMTTRASSSSAAFEGGADMSFSLKAFSSQDTRSRGYWSGFHVWGEQSEAARTKRGLGYDFTFSFSLISLEHQLKKLV